MKIARPLSKEYLGIPKFSRMNLKRHRVHLQPCDLPPPKKPSITANPSLDHDDQPHLKMDVGAANRPKPNPDKPQGDDSYFICAHRNTVAIADGVGGWHSKGIDAGHYARELMQNASLSTSRQPKESINPRTVLDEAFHDTKSQGSSTACIATLKHDLSRKKQYSLQAVNVGDSGFMLFRNNKLLFQSPTQQHGFNRPYQLGNSKKSDTPEEAEELEVEVMAGDIVVFGTDGIFDNVYPSDIERCIELSCDDDGERETPEELAWVIAAVSLCKSRNKNGKTPFEEAARKAGIDHAGGKIDDINVLVAYIVSC